MLTAKNTKHRRKYSCGALAFILCAVVGLISKEDITVTVIIAIALITIGIVKCVNGNNDVSDNSMISTVNSNTGEHLPTGTGSNYAFVTSDTVTIGSKIESNNAILIDVSNNVVLARKSPDEKIYPASMTKVMTLLVAAENVDDISATFKMTSTIIDPLYKEGATLAGFGPGETVTIKDMFYGAILESGAEATVGLAEHISGSEEEITEKPVFFLDGGVGDILSVYEDRVVKVFKMICL